MTVEEIQKIVRPVFSSEPVEFAAVFGSRARGDYRDDSDVDIVIKFSEPLGFIRYIGLENRLTQLLHRKVDLVSVKGINKLFLSGIKSDARVIYERRPDAFTLDTTAD